MDERRKFERVRLAEGARVYVLDEEGKRIGRVLTLGPGGMMAAGDAGFVEGSPHHIVLVDESERIRRPLIVVVRSHTPEGAILEFRALDVEAAIDIGIILGKHSAPLCAAHVA